MVSGIHWGVWNIFSTDKGGQLHCECEVIESTLLLYRWNCEELCDAFSLDNGEDDFLRQT